MTPGQILEVILAPHQPERALGLGFATLVEGRVVGVDILGAEQVSDVSPHVGLLKLLGGFHLGVGG